ncbi:MAG TPA: hypothetical protein DCF33_13150 [Saprospirales bacterium]|nr:hypothetical protein [Saprospirales bacterium]
MEKHLSKRHPFSLWILKALLFLLGIAAIPPGLSMMMNPSGAGVGFPSGQLDQTPFPDYFFPGLILAVFMGFFPLLAWFGLWKKFSWPLAERVNPFRQFHWAWTLSVACGICLMIWILVQITMVPYFFLQPTMFSWGGGIVLFSCLPSVRNYYQKPV